MSLQCKFRVTNANGRVYCALGKEKSGHGMRPENSTCISCSEDDTDFLRINISHAMKIDLKYRHTRFTEQELSAKAAVLSERIPAKEMEDVLVAAVSTGLSVRVAEDLATVSGLDLVS